MKVSFLLLICAATTLATFKVPLRRVKSLREQLREQGSLGNYLQYKAQLRAIRHQLSNSGLSSSPGSDEPVHDFDDVVYVAEVDIGAPGQKFNVVLDTGSSNLWVPDAQCGQGGSGGQCSQFCQLISQSNFCHSVCPSKCCKSATEFKNTMLDTKAADPCDGKNHFDYSKSQSYVEDGRPFSISYGTGSCRGFVGKDDVTLAGLTVKGQSFGQATNLAQFFAGQPLDGILGLAWPSIAEDGLTPVFTNMVKQGVVKDAQFAFYMSHEQTEGQYAGELTLGGYDQSRFTGDIQWVELTRKSFWQFNLDSIKVKEQILKPIFGKHFTAISDTGTSLIAGPSNQIRKIANAIGGAVLDEKEQLYKIDCNATNLPDVVFNINGHEYPVTSASYIVPDVNGTSLSRGAKNFGANGAKNDDNKCVLGFQPLGLGPVQWILGDVMIREFYTIYDVSNARVGLAKAVHDKPVQVEESTTTRSN